MDVLYLVGRILMALVFLGSGFGHFTQAGGMAQYARSKGVPAARLSVLVTGAMILAGGLSVLLGLWLEIGLWLLILFLLASAFMMHTFWKVEDPMQKAGEQAQFMKNLSIAGAAMIYYYFIQAFDSYGPFTLGSPM